jgi:ribosome assembly protein YihI (activator of Der GTPase)
MALRTHQVYVHLVGGEDVEEFEARDCDKRRKGKGINPGSGTNQHHDRVEEHGSRYIKRQA